MFSVVTVTVIREILTLLTILHLEIAKTFLLPAALNNFTRPSIIVYILTTDRRTTDLASCKISNGHISATGHAIHFMFGSRVKI